MIYWFSIQSEMFETKKIERNKYNGEKKKQSEANNNKADRERNFFLHIRRNHICIETEIIAQNYLVDEIRNGTRVLKR